MKRFCRKKPALFKLGQWHLHQDNAPVYNSILITDYLSKIGIKTVPQLPYSPDLAPCDFWLFPKLTGCNYETTEEMKGAVTKVIDTLTQEDSMRPSRSCWSSRTSALLPEEITSKGIRVLCVYYQYKCPYEKSLETYLMILVSHLFSFSLNVKQFYLTP